MRNVFRAILASLLLCCVAGASAQEMTKSDYERIVNSLGGNYWLVYNSSVTPNWIEEGDYFWYANRSKDDGTQFKLVDCRRGRVSELFDRESVASQLSAQFDNVNVNSKDLRLGEMVVDLGRNVMEFDFKGKSWSYGLVDQKLGERAEEQAAEASAGPHKRPQQKQHATKGGVLSPDGLWEVFIKDYNVYLYDVESDSVSQLSSDGVVLNPYSRYISWAGDSKQVVVMRTKVGASRRIPLIESAPKSQLQPILQWRTYLKPGDSLDIRLPYLYDVVSKREVVIDRKPFENQYNLKYTGWRKDGRGFTFEFNQRGHQLYQLVEVGRDGVCKIIAEESFPQSFVHYGRLYRRDLQGEKEMLWISERDGWRHLYLIDSRSGEVKNQITKGEWIVREVVSVDERRREILFYGAGRNAGEDPYNIHLYRVDFSGKKLVDLTPDNGNHLIEFAPNNECFVDRYSRPDMAPISKLRRMSDGRLICTLESADISKLLAKGWVMPEVFSAKGRDGKTDIWGTIYRPSNYSADKSYPIIEYIYAGPHDSHVPKNFLAYNYTCSRLAELGFIVVNIDGMGTANRSKAFHDVCWRNLKDAGFPDRELWIKAAAEKYPYMDTENVGVYGYSAGGQNAMSALLFFGDFYKTAVAVCGCHDNRMDKIWWNEQWMGYPIGKWYEESSNAVNANLLKGDLLLMNGELDDNVDPASTLQVVDALIKANKDFEMVYYPGKGHALAGQYELRKVADFFMRKMQGRYINWNK